MGMGGRRHAHTHLHPGKDSTVQELGGLQDQSARARKIWLLSVFHPRTVQFVASLYTD